MNADGIARMPEHFHDDRAQQTLVVMPAEAGIHIRRSVFMDSGFRRNDNRR
jgi:hypothetical protein